MAICKNIPKTNTRYCVGDMRRLIEVQIRDITPPPANSVDHDEDFTFFIFMHAIIETVNGISVFDETNTVVGVASHKFIVPFRGGITFENWIRFKGKRFRILDVTNIDDEDKFIVLRATERGITTKLVNKA
jgi:CRISPR/Cas system endoribonuclease Cas6 (RAMP superfamily)